jgi:hypothetical protein
MPEVCSSQPLVLSALSSTATIQPGDLALALWVLSTPNPPSKVVLPSSLVVRRRLARAGLVFAADRRDIRLEIEGEPVPVSAALGVEAVGQTLALEQFDLETSDRMRVVSRLESRDPPTPDLYGRHYYWIDGLGAASGHEERECFDRHSDQCLFEAADNVHRWSRARRSLAVVSATAGGGHESYNRLQVVVADDGIGIVGSVREKAAAIVAHGERAACLSNGAKIDSEIAADVVSDLVEAAYGDRSVLGARAGHGLSTVARHAARWNGTMNVISTFAPGRAMHHGRRGRSGQWNHREFAYEGVQGTLVHLTLDAAMHGSPGAQATTRREPAPV